MKDLIVSLPKSVYAIFSPKMLPWHVVAWVITYLLVVTDFDWKYFLLVRNESLNAFFRPALFGGFMIPVLLPLFLILLSYSNNNLRLRIWGFAIMQSAFLGWLISSVYKAFTGRIQPNVHNLLIDGSSGFQFGFLRHGIFWGWPSSHTSVAFAMSVAIFILLRKESVLARSLILLYAFYVGIGVSLSIHWFSDFVAGAIIGSLIGIVVGNRYKKQLALLS